MRVAPEPTRVREGQPRTLLAFARLPSPARRMAVEASLVLLLARGLVAHLPMRHWPHRLDAAPNPAGRTRRFRKMPCPPPGVSAGSFARLPGARPSGQCVCRRRWPPSGCCAAGSVPTRVVFAARQSAESGIEFHAWLLAGGDTMLGGQPAGNWLPFLAAGERMRSAGQGPGSWTPPGKTRSDGPWRVRSSAPNRYPCSRQNRRDRRNRKERTPDGI